MPEGRVGPHGARKSVPLAAWPEPDRRAWEAAQRRGDIFDDLGPAPQWSRRYATNVAYGYGRWLIWLGEAEPGALDLPPDVRITRERLRRYLDRLLAEVTAQTAGRYVRDIYDTLRIMAPNREGTWLRDLATRVARQGRSESKRPRMVAATRLLVLGLTLMDTADALFTARAIERHQQYRDGLIIALLACRPLRRSNFAAMRIGRHLQKVGESWILVFQPHETKARQPIEFPVPAFLARYFERYLVEVRPRFPRAGDHDGLWTSSKGCPMSDDAISMRPSFAVPEARSAGPSTRTCSATSPRRPLRSWRRSRC